MFRRHEKSTWAQEKILNFPAMTAHTWKTFIPNDYREAVEVMHSEWLTQHRQALDAEAESHASLTAAQQARKAKPNRGVTDIYTGPSNLENWTPRIELPNARSQCHQQTQNISTKEIMACVPRSR